MRKEDLKNILTSFTEQDYFQNVDLHIHSFYSDGKMPPSEIAEQAKKENKKYISITDHNTIDAYLSTNVLSNDIVIPGVEFDCYYKKNIVHIIGYGINIDSPAIRPLLAVKKAGTKSNFYRIFKLRNPQEVIERIKQADGIPVLAHPACYFSRDFDKFINQLVNYGLEGIEVYYSYRYFRKIFKFHSKDEIIELAEKYNLIKTGGTDTHGTKLLHS